MPRKKVPDRAELPEKLKHWANDNSIKASPDFLARMMDAAMHRPVPTVLGGLSFADLLCEAIPENEQRELVIEQAFRAAREKAYHEVPNKPYGSNLLEIFFDNLAFMVTEHMRQEPPLLSLELIRLKNQPEQRYYVIFDQGRIDFDEIMRICREGIASLAQLAEVGLTFAPWTGAEGFNVQQLQLLEDFKQWTWSGKAPPALYKHAMEALRLVPVLRKQQNGNPKTQDNVRKAVRNQEGGNTP